MRDIEIKGLCKAFDGKQVLRDFSAVLPAGQVTGLMAPSGAGKTTPVSYTHLTLPTICSV